LSQSKVRGTARNVCVSLRIRKSRLGVTCASPFLFQVSSSPQLWTNETQTKSDLDHFLPHLSGPVTIHYESSMPGKENINKLFVLDFMRRGWTEWGKWVGGRLTPFPSFSCVLKVDQAQGFQFAHNTGGHWPATSRHVMSCNFRTCTCLVRPKLCQRPDSES